MNISTPNKIPVLFLFGPTAVGKTELLMELFQGRAEIVSTDSVQVYKDLNIGSAKPDEDYLRSIPHHLIDICDYSESFSVGDFVRRADFAVKDIYDRGLFPVLSGGTAFYFKNFYYGLPEVKGDTSQIREELTLRLQQEGLASLWQELQGVDPDYCQKISSNDRQRIIRALEVYHSTGKPVSHYKLPDSPRDPYNFLIIGLQRPREELYHRINLRVEKMLEMGLEQEVHRLQSQGAHASDPGMKAIGYREFFSTHGDKLNSGKDVLELIQRNTRRYAKRQMTFFRSLPEVHWFHPEEEKAKLFSLVEDFISSNGPLT